MTRSLRILLVANAAIALANAALALAAPAASLSAYGLAGGSEVELMARFAAVGSVAIGVLAWLASRMEAGSALHRVVLALFLSDLIGPFVSVHGTLTGAMNAAGWGLAAVYALFAVGYGLFLSRAGRR